MVKYIKCDVTDVKHGIIAHGCNCQGVMGSGVALAIRKKWPDVFERYKWLCTQVGRHMDKQKLLGDAQIIIVDVEEGFAPVNLVVANLFTQVSYGRLNQKYASVDAIQLAMLQTFVWADTYDLPIYMPRIGCGLGGLDWDTEVGPMIEEITPSSVSLFVCDL